MKFYIELSEVIELDSGDMIQNIGINNSIDQDNYEMLDKLARKLNAELKCEGCEIHPVLDKMGLEIPVNENYYLAVVYYSWG